jgi:mRNA interferase MazF
LAKKSGNPAYVPKRGDAIWLDFDPQAGHKQSGRRPAVVLSPRPYNSKIGLAIVCPVTSQQKGYPFEVQIPSNLRVTGVVLSDQVKSLDWKTRNTEFIGSLPSETVGEILNKLAVLLSPTA